MRRCALCTAWVGQGYGLTSSGAPLDNARWGSQLPGHGGVQVLAWPGHGQAVGQYKPVQGGTRSRMGKWGCALAPWPGRYVYVCLYAYTFVHVVCQLGTYSRP